jgi:hypothetical protein
MAKNGLKTFVCSETQKFGHVTFFWNGNRSGYFNEELETYVEIPSDTVPFNEAPDMKAREICEAGKEALRSGKYDQVRINFANPDMVGHTGDLEATKSCCALVDSCVKELLEVVDELKGRFIVTSDHGNADDMAQVGSRRAAGRFVDALAGGRRAAGWTRWRAAPRLACSTGVCAPSTRHQLLHACLPPCLPPPVARQEDSEANHAGGQGRVADVAHPGARCAPLVFACPVPAMSLSNEGGRRALCTHHSSLDTLPVF